jgi:hypothetical protein
MMRTSCSIITTVSGNKTYTNSISMMNLSNNPFNDSQTTANTFNNYF